MAITKRGETIIQLNLGGSSDITKRRRLVDSRDHLSVFRTWKLVGNVLSWLEFLLVLVLGIMKKFVKLERANDSQIIAVKPKNRNQQD